MEEPPLVLGRDLYPEEVSEMVFVQYHPRRFVWLFLRWLPEEYEGAHLSRGRMDYFSQDLVDRSITALVAATQKVESKNYSSSHHKDWGQKIMEKTVPTHRSISYGQYIFASL